MIPGVSGGTSKMLNCQFYMGRENSPQNFIQDSGNLKLPYFKLTTHI